jgi:hypothetical protein
MLLVACAVGPTTIVAACGNETSGCLGFYPSDAMSDASDEQPSGCFGFYPTDARIEAFAGDATDDAIGADATTSDASDASNE